MDKVTLSDYFKYFVPQSGIEGVFLGIIIVLSVGTALGVWLSTRERKGRINCWEKRWTNNTVETDDDLKVEHGSIHELSRAVELPAEKMADVLPSMLLIIGLLGTFLGVGVALNEASKVLIDPNANSAQIVENAQKTVETLEEVTKSKNLLDEMMGMLDGLGALFKSSIYGIIGFFGFTFWKNRWGSDKARFKWCVARCNKEIEYKKKIQDQNTNKIINALNKVNESIGESIADCIQKSLQTALVKGFENVNKNLNEMNSSLCLTLEKTVVDQFKSLNKEMKSQVNETKAVVKKLENLANQSESQTNAMNSLSQTMTEQFTFVADSAKSMGTAADALAKSVDEFRPAVTETLESIREQFIKSITDSSVVMEHAGKSILNAVNEMSKKSKEGQDKLDETLSDFNKRINGTLKDIKQTTLAMEEQGNKHVRTIQELSEKIDEKLVSISTANLKIRSGMKELPKDLSQAINDTLQEVKQSINTSAAESTQKLTQTLNAGFQYVAKQNALVAGEHYAEKVESAKDKG